MRGNKLRGGVNWYRASKQKGVKQTGAKKGLGVCVYIFIYIYIYIYIYVYIQFYMCDYIIVPISDITSKQQNHIHITACISKHISTITSAQCICFTFLKKNTQFTQS